MRVTHRVVFEPLAHLLAVGCKHEAIADQVLEGRFVKQGRGEHHEGIEPTPGLVQALGHKVSGKVALEEFLVLKRVVELTIGHRATLKPAVKHLASHKLGKKDIVSSDSQWGR
jgi:hypothetical protein